MYHISITCGHKHSHKRILIPHSTNFRVGFGHFFVKLFSKCSSFFSPKWLNWLQFVDIFVRIFKTTFVISTRKCEKELTHGSILALIVWTSVFSLTACSKALRSSGSIIFKTSSGSKSSTSSSSNPAESSYLVSCTQNKMNKKKHFCWMARKITKVKFKINDDKNF